MRYTEEFKRQVVVKALSPGVVKTMICEKLEIGASTLQRWVQIYREEVQDLVPKTKLPVVPKDLPVDIDDLLLKAEQRELAKISGSESLAAHVDQIRRSGKNVCKYTDSDRHALVVVLRSISSDKQGVWLRQLGLQRPLINKWENELLLMSKKKIQSEESWQQLQEENKQLKKKLAEAERDNQELKILIELKKKYHTLFQQGEDKS